MLTQDLRDDIRNARHKIASTLTGYRNRPAQSQMIAEVARIAASGAPQKVALIEAQTGTGKSIAYLLGAVPIAKAQQIPVIVASATVALQEQLAYRDIPVFLELTGIDATVAIAKGRRRYLCPRNLHRLTTVDPKQIGIDFGEAENGPKLSSAEAAILGVLEASYASDIWDGDMDAAPAELSNVIKEAITTSAMQCDGRSCAHYWKCPVVKARQALTKAQIVVTNQDLLLADLLADVERRLLPAISEAILVVDEAHHLPRAAVEHFAGKVKPERVVKATLEGLDRAIDRAPLVGGSPAIREHLAAARERLAAKDTADSVNAIRRWVEAAKAGAPKTGPFIAALADEEPLLHEALGALAIAAESAAEDLRAVSRLLPQGEKSKPDDPRAKFATSIKRMVETLEHASGVMARLSVPDHEDDIPTARWVEDERNSEFVIVPVSASDALKQHLFEPARAVVMTSATLSSMGTFNALRADTGLADMSVSELRLPTPFPLEDQAELVIPNMQADAKDAKAHTDELKAKLPEWLNRATEGSLLLFASGKQMREVVEDLRTKVGCPVRMQGESPTSELLEGHRNDVQAGRQAVLAGLASFAEGLDLPGKQCSLVVIAKIPFAVPDHPLQVAKERWVTAKGGNYFRDVSVPEAFIRLVQACGRLIRTETDTGRIIIADRRLVTTTYGRKMLDELPKFRRVIERK